MKRLAIFSTGGIGAGFFSQGQPVLSELVEGLARTFDVTFYSLTPIDPSFRPLGYRIRAPSARLETHAGRLRWPALALRFLADNRASAYDRTLSFWGYPMGYAVVVLSKLARIPSALLLLGAETADVPSIRYGHMGRAFSRRAILWSCARASALIVVSKHQLDLLRQHGLSREDVHVIPLGANIDRFPFLEKEPSTPLRILHVANLTAVKDQTTLVEAFALLRKRINARLRIVGGDFAFGKIQDRVRELGLTRDVDFVGPLPFDQMPAQYAWADLFLLTSLSEGQNRALAEAALTGVLQVSTPVGHILELGESVAVVVRTKDPKNIAERIFAIVHDRVGWRLRVKNAHAWAESHSIDWSLKRLTEAILGTD